MVKRRCILLLLLILIIISIMGLFVNAENYYADVIFKVQDTGNVLISGITNHPALEMQETQELTSKQGKYWKLNISINETFSNFIYEIQLPKNSIINYMKLPDVARIEDSNNGLKIIGTGQNQAFEIILQYHINSKISGNFSYFIYIIIILVLLIGIYLFHSKRIRKKKNIKIPEMTDRQKLIFNFVMKSKKPLTQKNIEIELGLPKSSVSRNINSLQRKGLITKEQRGMSNLIKLSVPPSSGKFREK